MDRTVVMFSNYLDKHHIVLKKGHNVHIVWVLFWNQLRLMKLRLHKFLHGIHHPIVHYYAVCWNEEKMLPFMFDYYNRFVDHYTIYDNYSDDRSESIIYSNPKAKIVKFTSDGFNDTIHNDIKNKCWKRSRGKADYVVVCDIDEFFYHPDMKSYLGQMLQQRLTLPRPQGYDMYCEDFPLYQEGRLITDSVRNGIASQLYSKVILFDPHGIVEINFEPGCHFCHPVGYVHSSESEAAKMLHYKNLGLDALMERKRVYAKRLSQSNLEHEFGIQYLRDEETMRTEFIENLNQASPVI